MHKTHLSLQFSDAAGGTITPDAARFIDDQGRLAESFAQDGARGFALEISKLKAGEYELRIDLPSYPTLVFQVKLTDKGTQRSFTFRGTTPKCCSIARKHATAGDETSPVLYTAAFALGSQYQELVLVAGWDYSGGSDNSLYAKTWRDDLYEGYTWITGKKTKIARVVYDYTIVSLFDFRSGQRTRWMKGQKKWHVMDVVLQGAVPTRTSGTADERHGDDSISVVHVYEYIKRCGDEAAGSVVGLHVFSHSYLVGPILVNTYEGADYIAGGAKEDERDPGDKDARRKDFNGKNLKDPARLKAAFGADAIIKIWGCFAHRELRAIVRAAYDHRKTPDKKIKITYVGKSREMTPKKIVSLFQKTVLPASYMAKMAKAIGKSVWGAPPGTGANLKTVGKRNYMFVDLKYYSKAVKWYTTVLKLRADEGNYIPFG